MNATDRWCCADGAWSGYAKRDLQTDSGRISWPPRARVTHEDLLNWTVYVPVSCSVFFLKRCWNRAVPYTSSLYHSRCATEVACWWRKVFKCTIHEYHTYRAYGDGAEATTERRHERRRRETTSECAHDVNVTERMIEYAQRVCIASASKHGSVTKIVSTHKYTARIPSRGDEGEPKSKKSRSMSGRASIHPLGTHRSQHMYISIPYAFRISIETTLTGQPKRNRKKNKPVCRTRRLELSNSNPKPALSLTRKKELFPNELPRQYWNAKPESLPLHWRRYTDSYLTNSCAKRNYARSILCPRSLPAWHPSIVGRMYRSIAHPLTHSLTTP